MSFNSLITREKKAYNKPSKSPQIYMGEFKQVIKDLVNHPSTEVRNAACGHRFCPTGYLKERLMIETDLTVLKTIILNSKVKMPALIEFGSRRADVADQLADDEDIFTKLSR